MQSAPQPHIRIGIDIGGTFTDFVIHNPVAEKLITFKVASTPHDPAEAVLKGIEMLFNSNRLSSELSMDQNPDVSVVHGSTVATNALLERKGANTALITTSGFKDVIQIGRQNRPELYNFNIEPVAPLVPQNLRFEADERVNQSGKVLTPLDLNQVDTCLDQISDIQPEITSVAVVFLFSFSNPEHEQIVADKFRESGYFVSASNEILPEYREYERTSTTVVNAYVTPVLDKYLSRLNDQLEIKNLQIMQSNGGCISVAEAQKAGVRCILSGPAGGVVGSKFIAEKANAIADHQHNESLKLLTFDMGGTSTDVSMVTDSLQITTESQVGGFPIRVPILDIHTIGAGGGSIASTDAGGVLLVGPESAGADPGPACYGRPTKETQPRQVTVTDANLLLGRIPPDMFLGGEMPLYPELAVEAITPLAERLGLSITETALGIITIANAHMERALRVISVARGHDPRAFTLLSFGGAGSLHAAELARSLHINNVLIPPYAATLSALGMLAADVIKDYTQTIMLPGDTAYQDLLAQITIQLNLAQNDLEAEGFQESDILLEPSLDMRYVGQSYELNIPFSSNFVSAFHHSHQDTYGYLRADANIEIVNIRVRAAGIITPPEISALTLEGHDPTQALIDKRDVIYPDGAYPTPFYRGELLKPGNAISGPAVVIRKDTTILIGRHDLAHVDSLSNLWIEVNNSQ